MAQYLSDDELLNTPLGNLLPGELARSFKVRADHAHKSEETETLHHAQEQGQHVSEEQKHEEEQEQLHRREEALLARIAEQEEELREEAQRLDDRAIKLEDGRRAYVDGDDYRDAEGRKLTGADRAQAEVLHVEQPNATTWQEQRELEKRALVIHTMRHDVEGLRAGNAGADEAALLARCEKQMQRQTETATAIDYGDTDYMAAFGGLSSSSQAKSAPIFSR